MMKPQKKHDDSEFLWLVSLSDLMILLFVFFVVLFSFSFRELSGVEFKKAMAAMNGKEFRTPIDQVHIEVSKALEVNGLTDEVEVTQKDDELMINIKDVFLFESGQAVLKSSSGDIFKTLAHSLEQVPPPYRLAIEGHTDDTSIPNGSNFNLSTERALNVYHALKLSTQLKKRVVIMGYGKTSPRVPNGDAGSRGQNRRVTLRVF